MNHDISQPVPQGSDGAQDAENSRIAAIANQLERLCAVHEAQCGDSQQNVSCFETLKQVTGTVSYWGSREYPSKTGVTPNALYY